MIQRGGFSGVCSFFLLFTLLIAPSPAFSQPLEKVRIAYGARAIPFLPTFLAKEMGFYERQGLQAEAIQIAPRVVVSALTANEVDYTLTMGSTIRAAVQGLPVRGVSFSMRAPLFALVSQIGSPQEIRGKTIGVTFIGGLNHQCGKLMISHLGLNPDKDVTFVAIGDEKLLLQSLLSGRIGAATMSPPWIFEAEKNGRAENPAQGVRRGLITFRRSRNHSRQDQKAAGPGEARYQSGVGGAALHPRAQRRDDAVHRQILRHERRSGSRHL
jgi:ABC-type nitrate/sulfonate/bicarbonate transport system substrate-binding protein